MTQSLHTSTIEKVKNSIRGNWGSPFIAVFMLFLVSSAIFLSAGLSYLADSAATFAFFALVVGVILQLVSFFKFRKKVSEATDV
jgi:amino acid transporter